LWFEDVFGVVVGVELYDLCVVGFVLVCFFGVVCDEDGCVVEVGGCYE